LYALVAGDFSGLTVFNMTFRGPFA